MPTPLAGYVESVKIPQSRLETLTFLVRSIRLETQKKPLSDQWQSLFYGLCRPKKVTFARVAVFGR